MEIITGKQIVCETKTADRCPFCGSDDLDIKKEVLFEEHGAVRIFCRRCHALGPPSGNVFHMWDTAGAVDLWNARKAKDDVKDSK